MFFIVVWVGGKLNKESWLGIVFLKFLLDKIDMF